MESRRAWHPVIRLAKGATGHASFQLCIKAMGVAVANIVTGAVLVAVTVSRMHLKPVTATHHASSTGAEAQI